MLKRILLFLIACGLVACKSTHPENHKQTLRLNVFTEPPSLDPRKFTDATSANVLLMLFEGLTRMGEDHRPHPAAAEKITVSPDGRTYTFTLRKAYWSNGAPVTSYDFLYTWQTILEPKYPSLYAYKLYVIKNAAEIKEGKLPMSSLGVQTPNAQTLIVTLKYPTPYFLELVAFPTFFPVYPKSDQKNPEWASESGPDYVSNGPFKLKTWEHESEIWVEKNQHYWDAQEVKLDRMHLVMIDDSTTEFYMFEMGELDWAGSPLSTISPEFIPALKKEGLKDSPIHFYPSTATYFYKFNVEHDPVVGNVNIRKALSYAINRQEIVDHITQAGQQPATGLIPPMPGWKESRLFKDGDKGLAQHYFAEGLEELGLTVETLPQLTLSFNTNREHQKIAQAVQQQWKEVLGIEVQLIHYDWKVYLSKVANQDYQIARMGWVGDFNDPVTFLEPFKRKRDPILGGDNDTGWEHPDFIHYLDEAEKELNLHKREELLRKAEELLISEMPIIPLYYLTNGYLKKPYVKGVYLSPLGVADFKKAYIDKGDEK